MKLWYFILFITQMSCNRIKVKGSVDNKENEMWKYQLNNTLTHMVTSDVGGFLNKGQGPNLGLSDGCLGIRPFLWPAEFRTCACPIFGLLNSKISTTKKWSWIRSRNIWKSGIWVVKGIMYLYWLMGWQRFNSRHSQKTLNFSPVSNDPKIGAMPLMQRAVMM